MILFYFQLVIQNIFYGYVQTFYQHFYRLPLLEEAKELLVPFEIAKGLMGTAVYDWQEVWEYAPEERWFVRRLYGRECVLRWPYWYTGAGRRR